MGRPSPTVRARVAQIVAKIAGIEPEYVRERMRLRADLGFDTLQRVELALELEEALGLSLTSGMEIRWQDVADVLTAVHGAPRRLEPPAASTCERPTGASREMPGPAALLAADDATLMAWFLWLAAGERREQAREARDRACETFNPRDNIQRAEADEALAARLMRLAGVPEAVRFGRAA